MVYINMYTRIHIYRILQAYKYNFKNMFYDYSFKFKYLMGYERENFGGE